MESGLPAVSVSFLGDVDCDTESKGYGALEPDRVSCGRKSPFTLVPGFCFLEEYASRGQDRNCLAY